jgi:hypothetical protein
MRVRVVRASRPPDGSILVSSTTAPLGKSWLLEKSRIVVCWRWRWFTDWRLGAYGLKGSTMSPPHTIRVMKELLGCSADEDAGTDGKEHVHDALGVGRPREDDRYDEEHEHERALPI